MEDNKREVNEANTRGSDWEVVSLTASTYAAAPGPQRFDPIVQHKEEEFDKNEQDCSESMFMSKHFVVAPHEPENLPVEIHCSENFKEESIYDEKSTELQGSYKDKCKIDSNNDLHGSQLFGMGCSLTDHGMNLGDVKQEEDIKMVEKDHTFFVSPNNSSFDDEADMNPPIIHDGISDLVESRNPSQEILDYPCPAHGSKPNDENDDESFDDSSESWWKKRALSVYNHAKGTNTFWSIFVAVAVAGLAILGQRWRREKSQFQQFKWKFGGTGEKINRITGPVSQLKSLVGGNHRIGSMREGLHPNF